MKRIFGGLLIVVLLVPTLFLVNASGAPRRDATQVDDVFKPYTADDWVVSPDEEPTGDQTTENAVECDIRGVIACYDDDYLRVDILLENGVTFDWDVWYAIKLEYDDMNEYYTYYSDSKKLIYEKEKNGKIVKTVNLTSNKSDDTAGITDSEGVKNSDVYFIINKKDHIGGEKGKRYYLTCDFMSGYVSKQDKLKVADDTITVDMYFEF
jgi:hypothetical protein